MDLLDRLRDLIVLAAVPDAAASGLLEAPEDRLERMVAQAAGLGQQRLVRAAETVSAGLVEMRGTTSPRLLLELMCAQVLLPEPPPDAAADAGLAERVERLERHVGRARADAGPPALPSDPPAPRRIPERQPPPRSTEQARPPRPMPQERLRAAAQREPAPAAAGRDGATGPTMTTPGTSRAAPTDAMLRSRWPDVLESVRQVRKTAWMLLNSFATVESVDGNVLTLAFDREGNAKGFASSGSDGYLTNVLGAMFGVPMVVRTIVRAAGTDGGGTEPSRPVPAGGREPDAMGAKDGLSGTDLVMRELGGRVIDDIGEP